MPLAALFAEATPASLSALVREQGGGAAKGPLVPLASGRPGAPALVLVHEVSGGVLEYLDLCHELGRQGVGAHGVVAPGYDGGDERPMDSVERLAERYVDELLASDIAPPYRLVGWSFGGPVAYAMARRLETMGRPAAAVARLDAPAAGDGVRREASAARALAVRQMAERLEVELAPGADQAADALEAALREALVRRRLVAQAEVDRVLGRQLAVLEAHDRAMSAFRADGGLRSDLVLLAAAESPAADGERTAALWQAATAGVVRRRTVPGSHLTMVRGPNAQSLVEALVAEAVVPLEADRR